MHYPTAKANAAEHKDQRKSLRLNMTPAESLLWRSLRGRGAGGWKWRRQHGIGPFVLDFYCPTLRLCIELDGSAHDYTYEYDERRTAYLKEQGIRVVRFTNDQVQTCHDGVVAEIVRICGEMADNTDPAPRSAEGRLPLGDDRRRLPKQEGKNPSHPYLPTPVPLSPPLVGTGSGAG